MWQRSTEGSAVSPNNSLDELYRSSVDEDQMELFKTEKKSKWWLLPLIALGLVLGMMTSAMAGDKHVLRGVLCNTRSQIEFILDTIDNTTTLEEVVAQVNIDDVQCVHADAIYYMVEKPIIIGSTTSNGLALKLYQATLVGVLVGNNPRPVTPPTTTYFARFEVLEGSIELTEM